MDKEKSKIKKPVVHVTSLNKSAIDFKKSNTRFIKNLRRSILKDIKAEIKVLNKEYKENKTILRSYNKMIIESLYYIIDRDKFSVSVLSGIHETKLDSILGKLEELSLVIGKDKEKTNVIIPIKHHIDSNACNTHNNFIVCNDDIDKNFKESIADIRQYSKILTDRINTIITHKKSLQGAYNYIKNISIEINQ